MSLSRVLPIVVVILFGCSTGESAGSGPHLFGDPGTDRGIHLAATSKGFVITGLTTRTGGDDDDVLLMAVDRSGALLWQRQYGGDGLDWGWHVEAGGRGYRVVGTTADPETGNHDCLLVEIDLEGRELRRHRYGGEGDEYCWSGLRTDDAGHLLVGETTSDSAGLRDALLIRTDPAGQVVWRRRIGGAGEDRMFAVAPAGDGGFIAAGLTTTEGAGERDVYVIKVSSKGEPAWTRTFGGKGMDVGH
jgi:hypothetical protein